MEKQIFPFQNEEIFLSPKTSTQMWDNIDNLMRFFSEDGRLSKRLTKKILTKSALILKNQPNVLYLSDPITLIGDIHGQYHDLLQHFDGINIYNLITQNNTVFQSKRRKVLFLGDYVDRGNFSVQVTLLLMILKIYLSKTFFFLRGNHECRQVTQIYSFRKECQKKYNCEEIYNLFVDVFWTLPLAAVVNGTFFCVHGGLSQELYKVQDIQKLYRFRQISSTGLICDLLWSDPTKNANGQISQGKQSEFNVSRNCSIKFGSTMVKRFFHKNKFFCLIRAHQVQQQGYGFINWNINKFPDILTIFSAPNYCRGSNKGAIATIDKNVIEVFTLEKSYEPQIFPLEQINVFEISLPFIIFYVTKLFYSVIDCEKEHEEKKPNKLQIFKIFFLKDLKNPQVRKKIIGDSQQQTFNKKQKQRRKILLDICHKAKQFIENDLSFLSSD